MPAKPQKQIDSKILLVVDHQDFRDGLKATEIRVVDWIVDGKHYPQLEKRELFVDQEGGWKMGKAKGFSVKDLELVQDKWGEIMAALGKQPVVKAGALESTLQPNELKNAESEAIPANDF